MSELIMSSTSTHAHGNAEHRYAGSCGHACACRFGDPLRVMRTMAARVAAAS